MGVGTTHTADSMGLAGQTMLNFAAMSNDYDLVAARDGSKAGGMFGRVEAMGARRGAGKRDKRCKSKADY